MDRVVQTQRRKSSAQRRSEKRKSQGKESKKKEDQRARKGGKIARRCFSNVLWLRMVEK
jgi:hypothetical protein